MRPPETLLAAATLLAVVLLPSGAIAAPPIIGNSHIMRSNNIILMEGDIVGPAKSYHQYVIGPESQDTLRDISIEFARSGQIEAAGQSYGPNPVWESRLMLDDIGWISRSVVAVQTGHEQDVSQLISAYKTDERGRIVKVTEVEAGDNTIGITNQYYFYTPDDQVRFYVAVGRNPGFGMYLYRPDRRLEKVVKNDNDTLSTFTDNGKDLSSTTKTPHVTYITECQKWDNSGNCILSEKQEIISFDYQGELKSITSRFMLQQDILYYPPHRSAHP